MGRIRFVAGVVCVLAGTVALGAPEGSGPPPKPPAMECTPVTPQSGAKRSTPPVEDPLTAVSAPPPAPASEGTGGSAAPADTGGEAQGDGQAQQPAGGEPQEPAGEASASADDSEKDKDKDDDKDENETGFEKGKGFRIVSEDGNYALGVGIQAAYKLEPVWVDGEGQARTAFPFLRPRIYGNVFRPWVTFWTSLELAAPVAPYLLDSFVDILPIPEAGVRVGQFYTPLSRHESLGPQQILFPEFAPIANYFWTGRDKGITFLGTTDKLEYYAGIFSGSPLRTIRSIPGRWVSNVRLTVSPMGPMGYGELPYIMAPADEPYPFKVSFTVQGAGGKVEQFEENFNLETGVFQVKDQGVRKFITGGVDLLIHAGRFSLFGEAYLRRTEPENNQPNFTSFGTWLQADYVVYKKLVDVGVRLSFLNASLELDDDLLWIGELQVGCFMDAPYLAVKLRYQIAYQQTPDPALLGAVPLAKDPGTTNLITLQLNLYF
ncbi:hypothetical protein P2318_09575 [Myxococcaceae bacterium GXIMD 01537]